MKAWRTMQPRAFGGKSKFKIGRHSQACCSLSRQKGKSVKDRSKSKVRGFLTTSLVRIATFIGYDHTIERILDGGLRETWIVCVEMASCIDLLPRPCKAKGSQTRAPDAQTPVPLAHHDINKWSQNQQMRVCLVRWCAKSSRGFELEPSRLQKLRCSSMIGVQFSNSDMKPVSHVAL
jgi:hypothetical protein